MSEWREYRELREIEKALNEANDRLTSIEAAIADQSAKLDQLIEVIIPPEVTDFVLSQISGGKIMAITGVNVGGSATFQIGFVPPNGVPLQSGPTVTADDANVTLSAVDPTTNQFTASVAAGDTAATFNVTVAGVNGAGASLSHTFNVPISAAPPVQITDFTLDQVPSAPPATAALRR